MESTLAQVKQTKIFNIAEKERMPKLGCRVDSETYTQIVEIAEYEELPPSVTVRELLVFALRYYKAKRGTLNTQKPDNRKTFYCQSCNHETSVRRGHRVQMFYDEFQFCEPCFFSGNYKKKVIELLNNV